MSHSYILYTLVPKLFVVRILGQKNCLDIPYEYLNFFFSRNKVLDFFLGLGRNIKTCSNSTCNAKSNTLLMYLSMKKNRLSI